MHDFFQTVIRALVFGLFWGIGTAFAARLLGYAARGKAVNLGGFLFSHADAPPYKHLECTVSKTKSKRK